MTKNIFKDIFIILLVVFFLFLIFEIFSFFKVSKNEVNPDLSERYFPLIKHSNIKKQELENHIKNIKILSLENNGLREYHPNTIYIYKPNLKSETFYTNSLGLLDNEPNKSKNQIMLLGSSVAGGGLRQNFNGNENIDGFLEKYIQTNLVENYEVLNAGIGGFASSQELILMNSLIDKLDFNKIVYFSGANDVDARYRVRNFNNLRSYDTIHSRVIKSQIEENILLRKNAASSIYYYFKNYFLQSLYSYKYLAEILHKKRINKIQEVQIEKLNKNDEKIIYEIVKNYLFNVEKMIIIAKSKNIKLYVGIQPLLVFKKYKTENEEENVKILKHKFGYKYVLYFEKAYPLMRKGLDKLKKKYPEDIVVLNTENIFNETMIDIFRDNSHFLDYANDMVAKQIFSELNFDE